MLLGTPRPASLASCSADLLNKLPQKMELVKIQRIPALGNAPKGLSSEFHKIRSKTKTTLTQETANGTDPLVKRTGPVNSIAAPLASLAPLR